MELKWTAKARSDVLRLHAFIELVNPRAAAGVVQALIAAPERLLEYPRLGERLEQFDPREVRRIFVGDYELRYEVATPTIYVLRVWHGREQR